MLVIDGVSPSVEHAMLQGCVQVHQYDWHPWLLAYWHPCLLGVAKGCAWCAPCRRGWLTCTVLVLHTFLLRRRLLCSFEVSSGVHLR